MKIRSGFVSNSSSSSFVVIAPKTDVDAVLTSVHPYVKAVAEHVEVAAKKFMGHYVCVFQGSTGNEDSWEYSFEYNGDDQPTGQYDALMPTWEAWDIFIKTLKEKCGENILTSTAD